MAETQGECRNADKMIQRTERLQGVRWQRWDSRLCSKRHEELKRELEKEREKWGWLAGQQIRRTGYRGHSWTHWHPKKDGQCTRAQGGKGKWVKNSQREENSDKPGVRQMHINLLADNPSVQTFLFVYCVYCMYFGRHSKRKMVCCCPCQDNIVRRAMYCTVYCPNVSQFYNCSMVLKKFNLRRRWRWEGFGRCRL